MENLRIGVPTTDTYLLEKIRNFFKEAEIIIIKSIEDYLAGNMTDVDVIIGSAEEGAAWTLLYPKYKVVIPEDFNVTQTIAYGLKADDYEWKNFLDNWLYLKKESQQFNRFYKYWILGIDPALESKQCSIIKDVLHWVE